MMYSLRKNVFLFLFSFVCVFVSDLAAQEEFSFDFDSTLGFAVYQYTSAEDKITPDLSFDLFMEGRHNIGSSEALYYRLGGWISYSRYREFQGHLQDLSVILALGEEQPTQLNLTLGRQPFADPTGNIVAQSLDGLNASLKADIIQAHLGFGYLGLFPANHNNIVLSPDDESEKKQTDWGTAPDRFLILGDFGISIIPTILLGLHLGTQIDLRQDPSSYGYTSWYTGLHSRGFVFELLEYSAQITVNGGHFSNTDEPAIGVLLSNHWFFTFPGEGVGRISAGVDFASGENEEASNGGFRSISHIRQGDYFEGSISQLIAPSWQIEWEPLATAGVAWLRDLNVYIKGKHYWSTSTISRTVGILQTTGESNFLGHELSMGFSVSPLSDFGIEGIMGAVLGSSEKETPFFSKLTIYLKI